VNLTTISKIKLGAIVVLLILILSLIFSQTAASDSPFFGIKRLQEKAFMKLKGTPEDKLNFMSTLLDHRLKELQDIIEHGSFGEMWTTSLRYSTQAGEMTDLVIANNMVDKVEGIKNQFSNHKKILNDMYVAYPKNTNNLEYKYIEDDMNYLNLYLEKLSKI